MMKLIFILIPFVSFGQFTIDRIAYDPGGTNDTLWTRDGSNKDTLFRRVDDVFVFGHKPLFRKYWTISDIPDLNPIVTGINNSLSLKANQTDLTSGLATKQNTITVLPFASGGVSVSAAAPATTGAMTVPMTSSMITITPTGACTFNASGGVAGQRVTFIITTSGTTSFTLTFGTNFRKVGTLATGTTSARFFAVTFICINGTVWQEISRTAAQT